MKRPVLFLAALAALFVLTAPCFAAPVQDGMGDQFTIRPGDVLQITVWKEDGLDQEVIVLPDGTMTFPLVGTIQAEGLTPAHLQMNIKSMLANLIPDAAVTVMVKAPLGHVVSVLGQVAKPGDIVMGRTLSVMQALSQAGGPTPFASEGKIIVIRKENGEKKSIPVPYDDLASGEHLEKDIALKPGDIVFVPTAGLL